jgi:GNAT superfamily N-acetyltransferase
LFVAEEDLVGLRIEWATTPDDPLVHVGAELGTEYWREALGPEEPEYPTSELAFELSAAPQIVETRLAIAVDGDDVIGAVLQRFPLNQRRSSWLAWIYVTSGARGGRGGAEEALFNAAADAARQDGRSRLGWKTPTSNRAAVAFSLATGAVPDETLEHNRLTTTDVDRSLLVDWIERAHERASDYSLVGWDGPCPEELLDPFTRLQAVMDDAPGVQPELVVTETPMTTRARERRWLARGPYWRLCTRHAPTGELVAFTELQVPTTRPGIADQGDTAVRLDHRERGIGRWLKAANMLRLVDTRPEVQFVDTINAADNAPMIGINREMGFRPVLNWQRWDLAL